MIKSRSVDSTLDALFQVSLPEFTRTRDALVASLRKQGRPDAAAEVKAIRRPSVSAWAVNQLYFGEPALWTQLKESARALRRAYGTVAQGGAADAARQAQKQLGQAIEQLLAKARVILQRSRQAASAATLRRIGTTLHALAVRAPTESVRAGRLVADVEPPGVEALTSMVGEARPVRSSRPAPAPPQSQPKAPPLPRGRPAPASPQSRPKVPPLPREPPQDRARARAARQERERLARELKRAKDALRKAQGELAARTRVLQAAERQVEAARQALSTAEAAHERAARAQRAQ